MAAGVDTRGHVPATGLDRRRNRAEWRVRKAISDVDGVYVDRTSWHAGAHGPEVFVAIVARTEEARTRARTALERIGGLTAEQWASDWIALSLGDWMIRIFPERAR